MKKHLLFIIFTFSATILVSQQNINITNIENAKLNLTPAAAGIDNSYNFANTCKFLPKSSIIYPFFEEIFIFDLPIKKISSGVGIVATYSDHKDWEDNFSISLNYAYHFNFDKVGLSLGLAPGYKRTYFKEHYPYPYSYPTLNPVIIDYSPVNIYYLKVGTNFTFKGFNMDLIYNPFFQRNRFYYSNPEKYSILHTIKVFTGYEFRLLNKALGITPSYMIDFTTQKYNPNGKKIFRLLVDYKQKISAGFIHSGFYGTGGILNYTLGKNFNIGYSLLFSNLQSSAMQHELLIRYQFAKE